MSRPDSRTAGFGPVWRAVVVAALLAFAAVGLHAAVPPARFPQPEFESGYVSPLTSVPPPRALALEYADVGVLAAALALASWLAVRRRSRAGLVALALFTVAYFGFFRRGCVCPVGAIQNVAAVLADPVQVIPWTVAAFFLLPLVFAALFGRVFCASVCPLGVLQELVLWKPVRLPAWLSAPLGMLPVLYLGAAVLLAATGADYLICRTDPFIGFYRLGGPLSMLLAGGLVLVLALFVGRPYCRFLCPYGVLLGWISRFAYRPVTITPDACIRCRLCETACPYDCIRAPDPAPAPEPLARTRRRLVRALVLVPLLALVGAALGAALHVPLARAHAEVRLAERIALEEAGGTAGYTVESETFRASGRPLEELAAAAARIRRAFRVGSILLGVFIGLVAGLRLVGAAVPPRLACHAIDHATCVSCARCFASCSMEQAARADAAKAGAPAENTGGTHAG